MIERGATLAIYVTPEALAEAQSPTVDPAGSGAGFWRPGPERFYGWALRDLRDCLEQMTGADLPLTASDPKADRGIFAGTFDQFPDFRPQRPESQEALASDDPEAFVVELHGAKLHVLGRTSFGLIAGIYGLLDHLGCKWYAPGEAWSHVPRLEGGLALDERLNVASAGPTYNARFFFSSWGANTSVRDKGRRERDYTLWELRNRNGGSGYVANYHNAPILPLSLFAERPELFALVGGQRDPRDLARGNPEAIAKAVAIAIEYFKTHEGQGSYYDSFSVENGDGAPHCEESLAKVGNHTPTDLMFGFANQMAEGLDQAGLTDKWVGLYSYSDHAGIPTFDLHPRVGTMVTTALDFSSGLTTEQRLAGLRERQAQRLGIYDYLNLITWSLDKPGAHPAGEPLRVAENLKRWHAHGATGYLAETSDSWVNGGAGHYLASRMLWDANRDPEAELTAYYQGAFGPAAAPIRALNEDWQDLPRRAHLSPGALAGLPRISRGKCAQWHAWISEADRLAGGDATFKARINQVKRYYLYLNLTREFELDLTHAAIPSKLDRYLRLVRYVGSQRGEGAMHAVGLFLTLAIYSPPADAGLPPLAQWGPEFAALAANWTDQAAWETFPALSDAQIDGMFEAVRLPLGDEPAPDPEAVFDPRLARLPTVAAPPPEVRFPKLHGPPAIERQYVLDVVRPTPKLIIEVRAEASMGGVQDRTFLLADINDRIVHREGFKVGNAFSFEMTDVKPGRYTVILPEFGAEQVTVRGGNTIGAVRLPPGSWGFNPFFPAGQQEVTQYFVVPAGWDSLRVGLARGTVTIGLADGMVIGELDGPPADAAAPPAGRHELRFTPADQPRIGYVTWKGSFIGSEGFVIEGVTLYSPDASNVLYESLH